MLTQLRGARFICGLFAALAAGCSGDDLPVSQPMADATTPSEPDASMPAPNAARPVSYSRDVRPIFDRCTICHHPGGIIDLDLANPFDPAHGLIDRVNSWHVAHESPFDVVVKPGRPDDSFLIYKVSVDPDHFDTTNNGDPMPMQVPRVSEAELANIKQWIIDGARNDAFYTENVAPIFGTEITLGGKRGKCTLCHYPDSPTGLDILAVFDASRGLVGADSLRSTKLRVAPGSPEDSFLVEKIEQANPSGGAQMPLHYARLSQTEIEMLRSWIADGAANN
jgi:hypothetical protein